MNAADRSAVVKCAHGMRARVVDFFEVGGVTPVYTVRKAGGKKTAARIVADKLEPKSRREFVAALSKLKGHVDESKFARAFSARNERAMFEAIDFAGMERSLHPALGTVLRVYQDAAKDEAAAVGGGRAAVAWGFDLSNPKAVEWGYQWSSELITQITDDTKSMIKDIVGQTLDAELSRTEATAMIRNVVGLTGPQAQAVANFRDDLFATGASTSAISAKVETYAGQLLTQRAELIARTEIMSAANAGQREAWDQAEAKGLIDAERTQRMWIVTDDDRLCEECEPYDGVSVDFGDEFEDGDPPLHPGCRCTVGLTFSR